MLIDGREGRGADAAGDEFLAVMNSFRAVIDVSVPVGPSLAMSLSRGGSLEYMTYFLCGR